MSACEKCWSAAYVQSRTTGQSQVEAYQRLLAENPDGHVTDAAADE